MVHKEMHIAAKNHAFALTICSSIKNKNGDAAINAKIQFSAIFLTVIRTEFFNISLDVYKIKSQVR